MERVGPATRRGKSELIDALRDTFRLAPVPAQGVVQAIERDGTQRQLSATVRLGDGDVTVQLDGRPVAVGQTIEIERSVGSAVDSDWRFVRHVAGLAPFPQQDTSADIPAPTWLAPPLATAVSADNAGVQYATVTVRLRETAEDYQPSYTEVWWATDEQAAAGTWQAIVRGNTRGVDAEMEVVIPGLPMGIAINVQARTVTVSGARSDWSEIRAIITATDQTAPSPPGSITVDVEAAFTAIITLPTPSRPLVFDHWDISIATSAGGVNAITYRARSQQFIHQTIPGDIYVRAREVTRAGVASAWFPTATWQGPYTIKSDGGISDTTPPPAPVLAAATAVAEMIQGVMGVTITSTLASYSPPADFSHFEVRHNVAGIYEFFRTTETVHKRYDARQGVTIAVDVRAFDKVGNASAWSNAVAVSSPAIVIPPNPGAAPTVIPHFKAHVLQWSATPDSVTTGRITSYELQRAPDVAGLPGTWATVANPTTTRWVDAPLAVATAYHYRYRPINAQGAPSVGYSPSASATTLAVENGDIAANAITANKLAASIALLGEIIASDPGQISAGNGNVILHQGGITINGDQALHFTGEPAGNWSAIKADANRRLKMRVVENWRGYSAVGRGVHFDLRSETTQPALYLTGPVTGSTTVDALVLTEDYLRFIRDTGGGIVRGWQIGFDGLTRGDGSVASGWTPHYHNRTWETTAAGVDVGLDMTTLGLPSSGVTGVMLRYSVSVTAGRHFYVHAGGANAPEHGLHHVTAGATTNVAVFGVVPVLDGLIYLRSTVGTVIGTLVVIGYFR